MHGAFLFDNAVGRVVRARALNATAAGMPIDHLFDPQPRVRVRFLTASASVIFDFGEPTELGAMGVISTSFAAGTRLRWRAGTPLADLSNIDFGQPFSTTGEIDAGITPGCNGNSFHVPATAWTYQALRLDISNAGSPIDFGLVVAGPLWRLTRGVAYGVREGRVILDGRDRNRLTATEFPLPAVANPRFSAFTLPVVAPAEVLDRHFEMLRMIGGVGDVLWIPNTSESGATLNKRALWGGINRPGEQAGFERVALGVSRRSFTLTERL